MQGSLTQPSRPEGDHSGHCAGASLAFSSNLTWQIYFDQEMEPI